MRWSDTNKPPHPCWHADVPHDADTCKVCWPDGASAPVGQTGERLLAETIMEIYCDSSLSTFEAGEQMRTAAEAVLQRPSAPVAPDVELVIPEPFMGIPQEPYRVLRAAPETHPGRAPLESVVSNEYSREEAFYDGMGRGPKAAAQPELSEPDADAERLEPQSEPLLIVEAMLEDLTQFRHMVSPDRQVHQLNLLRARLRAVQPAPTSDTVNWNDYRPAGEAAALLEALVTKLDEILAHPAYKGVFTLAHVHGMSYKGPKFDAEYDAARAYLEASRAEQPSVADSSQRTKPKTEPA
jgi:hypothetical protein